MRGAAALIVTIVHYFGAFRPYSVFGNRSGFQQQSTWENLCHFPFFSTIFAGHFAVCLFFILSGYVLSIHHFSRHVNRVKLFSAMVKRPIRLGGLVLFTVLLSALIQDQHLYFNAAASNISSSQSWLGNFRVESRSSGSLLVDIVFRMFRSGVIYNPPLWTIEIELYGSLMVYSFLFFPEQFRYRLAGLTALSLAFQATNYLAFLLGMIAAVVEVQARGSQRSVIKPAVSVSLIVVGVFLAGYPYYLEPVFRSSTMWGLLPEIDNFGGGYPMLAAVLLFCGVGANEQVQRWLDNTILRFIGRISFGLYAVHFILIGSFSSWLFVTLSGTVGREMAFWTVLTSGLVLNCAVAYLVTIWVDNPVVEMSAGVGRFVDCFLQSKLGQASVARTLRSSTLQSTESSARCTKDAETLPCGIIGRMESIN